MRIRQGEWRRFSTDGMTICVLIHYAANSERLQSRRRTSRLTVRRHRAVANYCPYLSARLAAVPYLPVEAGVRLLAPAPSMQAPTRPMRFLHHYLTVRCAGAVGPCGFGAHGFGWRFEVVGPVVID